MTDIREYFRAVKASDKFDEVIGAGNVLLTENAALKATITDIIRLAREDLPENDLDFFAAIDGETHCGVCKQTSVDPDSLLCCNCECRRFQLRKLLKEVK